MKYIIVTLWITRDGEYFAATCKELGTASFGSTEQEALANVIDATELYLSTLEDLGECSQVLSEKGVRVYSDEPAGVPMATPPTGSVFSGVIPLSHVCA